MLAEAFPDQDEAITKSFFTSTDSSSKTWSSVKLLAESDNITFWTVIAQHRELCQVFTNLVTAVDEAHSSASITRRRAVQKEDEHFLCIIFIRLVTTTNICIKRHVSVTSLAIHLDKILPLPLLFPISVMLLRRSGSAASVCLTSFFLLNPGYLCRLSMFMMGWYDTVNRIATRCKMELQRGRFQRMAGDILPHFEHIFRHVRGLWAAIHCSPFLTNYISISRVLRSLRIVVDVISPVLQHFVILCKDLNPIRDVLSQANSVLMNSALNASVVLILFHSFGHAGGRRSWVLPRPVEDTYAALRESIQHYTIGVPEQLVGNHTAGKDIPSLFEVLVPATMDEEDMQIGKVILTILSEDIQGSNDFIELLSKEGCRHRYGELLLLELVHQGIRFDELLRKKFLTIHEAERLGACEEVITCALSRRPDESDRLEKGSAGAENRPNSVSIASLKASEKAERDFPPTDKPCSAADPVVTMVQEVFPHYTTEGIRVALDYYGDVEQLILDASMDNIPPHLVGVLTSSSSQRASKDSPNGGEVSAGHGAPHTCITKADFDNNLDGIDLHLYLGNDLWESLSGHTDDQTAVKGDGNKTIRQGTSNYGITSYRKEELDIFSNNSAFTIDEDLKSKIRMLNELLYEDELDDTGFDELAALDDTLENSFDSPRTLAKSPHESVKATEEMVNRRTSWSFSNPALNPTTIKSNSNYDYKQSRVKQAKERAEFIKKQHVDGASATNDSKTGVPSYAIKKKSEKRPLKQRGTKNTILKALRKGHLYTDS